MTAKRLALLVAFLLLGFLAVNTWVAERQSKDAEGGIGRVVRLPGGDVHVREDGDRRDPPLLLIHGWVSTMRWWDRVTPALARDFRVIRVDLLGHGGSEKPDGGYSIEKQADLVDGVLERLGVRRAVVVGHSRGGAVATALVERHRSRVERLMVIGTAPNPVGHDSVMERLTFAPVVGHALRTLGPDAFIRRRLEDTFISSVEVPDHFVDALDGMTFSAFRDTANAGRDYREERELSDRLADERLRLHVVFGADDNVADPDDADGYREVPGARIVKLRGLMHTPHWERPGLMTRMIRDFARAGG